MMVRGGCKTHPVPEHQADAALDQSPPISGTKYVVLDTTRDVRIISIMVKCTWTVQPTPIELHVTIDGHALLFSFANPVSNIFYIGYINPNYGELLQFLVGANDANLPGRPPFILEGRSVKIEAETTGGTVSNLVARVKYAKW